MEQGCQQYVFRNIETCLSASLQLNYLSRGCAQFDKFKTRHRSSYTNKFRQVTLSVTLPVLDLFKGLHSTNNITKKVFFPVEQIRHFSLWNETVKVGGYLPFPNESFTNVYQTKQKYHVYFIVCIVIVHLFTVGIHVV